MKKYIAAAISVLLTVCMLASCSNKKQSAEPQTISELGISFEYPAGWTSSVDEEEGILYVVEQSEDEFADNVYITVAEQDEYIKNYTEEDFSAYYSNNLENYKMDSFKAYNHFFGENDDTYAIEINGITESDERTVYSRQYIFNKNEKSYSITFSTLRRQFPTSFEEILNSISFYTEK